MTEDQIDAVSKALRQAWQLGQTYWRQADSESYRENAKSDATQAKFDALVDETRSLLSASIADTATHKLVPIEPTLEMQYAAIDTGCCTRPTDTYAAMLAAAPEVIADTAGAKQQLSNLLARIHRDGGHYEAEHGTGKAVDDADLIVAKLNAAADAAQKPIAWINADANYCTKDAIAAQHVEGLIPVFAAPPAPSVADAAGASDRYMEGHADGYATAMKLAESEIRALIADDAYAMSFQTMGQYRSALLNAIKKETGK